VRDADPMPLSPPRSHRPPLAGLGAVILGVVIMRDFTVRDCRRSQGAKDRSGACARIANLQADAQHIEREMAQLRAELEQALRPWWRLGRRRRCTVSEPSRPYVREPEPIPEVEALAAAEAMARSRRKGGAHVPVALAGFARQIMAQRKPPRGRPRWSAMTRSVTTFDPAGAVGAGDTRCR
jgi:hypothetical protein